MKRLVHAERGKRTKRLAGFFLFPLVIGLALVYRSSPDRTYPPLSVHFTGRTGQVLHQHGFGEFIVTNHSGEALHWQRAAVESPQDTALWISAMFDSNLPRGVLASDGSTNVQAVIPNSEGMIFRLILSYSFEPRPVERLQKQVTSMLPFIERVGTVPTGPNMFTSQWFYATGDFERFETNSPSLAPDDRAD